MASFLPFWLFLTIFRFGGVIHYSLLAPLGEKLLPLWIVGLLIGASSIVQLLLDVPVGYLMDKKGYRLFLKLAAIIFIFAAACLLFGLNITAYIASIAIATFSWLFFGPALNAYILSHAPKEKAGRFISLRDVFGAAGVVLASAALPFIFIFTIEDIGLLLFLIFGLSLAMIFFSPKDIASIQKQEKKLPTQNYHIKRNFLSKTIKAIKKLNPASGMLLLSGMSGSIFYGIIWFVVPLVIANQADSGLLGIGLGIFDLAIVALGFFLGRLADKADKRQLIFFGLLIFSVAGLLLGFNFGWLFLIFGFLATTGDEMAGLSLWSWLHALDKDHDQDGTVSSVINLFQDLGWAIGPIAAGLLYPLIGPSWTIVIGALPILATCLFYQSFMSKKHFNLLPNFASLPAKPHRPRHKT